MKGLQVTGLTMSLLSLLLAYFLLVPVEPSTPSSSAGAAGLGIMFIVLPALGASAIMFVPTSVALLWGINRIRSRFTGLFWYSVWALNGIFTLIYMLLGAWLIYMWAFHAPAN
ncbi:hypothetical protein Mag101_08415 [Microbulbifer agarilyticus]|uniref:Uncharacterized protein n=1 Tax=Microbulbifer agarilyticus TaxID=260552 RepID=A0A1Q2M536_9GAMM|nr:hypothetical protein Mag101_08415 [Microbulbifer agarilyticus]